MKNGLGRTTLSSLAVVFLIGGSLALDKLRVAYQWKQMDYDWPNNETKEQFPFYRQEDNLPLGLEVAGNRLFITVPRWKPGVAASLNYIMLNDTRQSPPLIPYPSWEAHQYKPGKVPDIVSTFRIRADRCNRLWVLDTGLSNIADTPESQRPPTLLIYDLSNDRVLRNYTIPENQMTADSLFANIAVEDESCTDSYGYLADLGGPGIVVYSWKQHISWLAKHEFFRPDVQSSDFNVSGITFHWNDGIFGMALQPSGDGYSTLYFHPLCSTKEFSVSTKFLRDQQLVNGPDTASQYKYLGSRGNNAQSSVSFLEPKTGILLYALVNFNAIACWRTGTPYDIQNHRPVYMNNVTMVFPNDLKIDSNGNIWVLSDRLPKFMYDRLDPQDYNFRILTGSLKEAVQGTACSPDYPNQPSQVMTNNRSAYGRSDNGYQQNGSGFKPNGSGYQPNDNGYQQNGNVYQQSGIAVESGSEKSFDSLSIILVFSVFIKLFIVHVNFKVNGLFPMLTEVIDKFAPLFVPSSRKEDSHNQYNVNAIRKIGMQRRMYGIFCDICVSFRLSVEDLDVNFMPSDLQQAFSLTNRPPVVPPTLALQEKRMGKLESSIPGLGYPSGRDDPLKTGQGYLDGRKRDDGAEGLWRIKDDLYDLQNFVNSHPGGAEWINITKGTDITEAFEVHHLTAKPEKLLPKFFVRKAVSPRLIPFTFLPDGFYTKLKERAKIALKDVDFHNSATKTNLIADSIFVATLTSSLIAAYTNFWMAFIISGLFLAWTTIAGHNFTHMKQNFRMYYFDLSTMSSKEFRMSHCLCHHLYPNTIWDQEIYTYEPIVNWLPYRKTVLSRIVGVLLTPMIWVTGFWKDGMKRYYMVFMVWKKFELRDCVPFILPLSMCLVAPNPVSAFKSWLVILACASFIFFCIGLNAGHHHPDIFHDGDVYRKDLDWGLLTLDTVRGREIIDDFFFLTLTHFGSHIMHHLLPTVDHSYLHLCEEAYQVTCKEFGITGLDTLHPLELVKGQFQQQIRTEKISNSRKYGAGRERMRRTLLFTFRSPRRQSKVIRRQPPTQVHHLTDKPEKLLPIFYVRQAVSPRSIPFTFSPDGFYKKFKQRVKVALKDVDFHNPAKKTNLLVDTLLAGTLISSLVAAVSNFWMAFIMSGMFLAWTTIASHNYIHMKQNFRMYYFDLSLMSSKEWRITHALSHHLYPNTIWDQEVYSFEPVMNWLPYRKTVFSRIAGILLTPVVWVTGFFRDGIKRYYLVFMVWKKFEFRDFVPFTLPLLMCIVAPNPVSAFKSWLVVIACASFIFLCIGTNAAHHHPDIFHDGDIYRKDLDWGLLAIDTVRNREIIDDFFFLIMTNFGSHVIHHLLPTVDHLFLPLCRESFGETCKEFGIADNDRLHPLELVKGQFQQQIRVEKINNCRK
ncbi:uncharacterized protein LOC117178905 [Belonocnema kinseyi]|uniref:uncharacterized protein LOC117178905 n=1 Tax=Belonocnema kinseyi TaxID=2817044 RepID=UPI00143DE2D4|nr:uncharacterized protein LOC117178905 [Belonocnema kinseyi]